MSKNVPIKDFCKIDWGNTNLTKKSYVLNGDFLAVSAKGMDGRINFFEHENDVIVLSAIGAQCGKMFFPKQKFTAIKNTITIKPDINKALPDYLFYLFNYIELPKRGSAQPFISKGDIEKFTISFLPKLNEQQRIVEKLDTCMEQIDKAIQNVEQNIQNAEELFQSQLNEIFNQKGDGWTDCNLKDVCKFDKIKNKRLDLPYVGLEHIESNTGNFIGSLDSRQVKSSTFHFNSKHILYGRLRPYLNKVLIPDFEGHCSSEIFPILVNDSIKREFLFFWLISSDTVKKINATCTGARMPRANMNELIKLNFSFPSIDKQEALVQKLNRLNKECNTLHNNYIKELDAIDDLKQSILEKAFNGEL